MEKALTQDDVRRIVREEITRALHVLADTANGLIDYRESDRSAVLEAVSKVARTAVLVLPHGVGCRMRYRSSNECTCGVENDG